MIGKLFMSLVFILFSCRKQRITSCLAKIDYQKIPSFENKTIVISALFFIEIYFPQLSRLTNHTSVAVLKTFLKYIPANSVALCFWLSTSHKTIFFHSIPNALIFWFKVFQKNNHFISDQSASDWFCGFLPILN